MRLDYVKEAPGAYAAMRTLNEYVKGCGIEAPILELVKIRASQINGCAYCLEMHTRDARAAGEKQHRLDVLSAWRETPLYTERERAALAWAEAVTLVSWDHVPDTVYEEARKQFSERELVDLTMAIILINGWNRLAISFRTDLKGGRE